MQIHELNHVALRVADVEKSSVFYREVLRRRGRSSGTEIPVSLQFPKRAA